MESELKDEACGGAELVPRPEAVIKHPLEYEWTMWYFLPDKKKTWEENLQIVQNFSTVEDFWCLFHWIKKASELKSGCDYSMFKKGIQPMWEDDANRNGGRWLISLEKRPRSVDDYWLEILLCMIGEKFGEFSGDICGSVVNIRPRGDKISLWTRNSHSRDSIMGIGCQIQNLGLPAPRNALMEYQSHKDTQARQGSSTKSSCVLPINK